LGLFSFGVFDVGAGAHELANVASAITNWSSFIYFVLLQLYHTFIYNANYIFMFAIGLGEGYNYH
jgi:hypothetical protein